MLEVISRISHEALPAAHELHSAISPDLSRLLGRATARDPADRFDSVEAFIAQLDALSKPVRTRYSPTSISAPTPAPIIATQANQARRAVILTIASLVVAALALLIYLPQPPAKPAPTPQATVVKVLPRPVIQNPVRSPIRERNSSRTTESAAKSPPQAPAMPLVSPSPRRKRALRARPSLSQAEVLRRNFLTNPPQNDGERQNWNDRVLLLAEEIAPPVALSRIERLLMSGRLIGNNGGIEAALSILCGPSSP